MRKFIFAFFVSVLCIFQVVSQDSSNKNLLILPQDIRIEKTAGGYNLFIRKKPGLESVMLTETTKDPNGLEDNYAYRAKEYNPVNGDEIRLLDGKIIDKYSNFAPYSLIDSNAQPDLEFGQAFLIFIPEEIVYGYGWTRNGSVKIGKGTFINIRGFERRYCDYSGGTQTYLDNPYMFDFTKSKEPVVDDNPVDDSSAEDIPFEDGGDDEYGDEVILTDDYNPVAADKFEEISDMMIFSKGPDSLLDDISKILQSINPKNLVDIVFAIDATGSMKDDIEMLRERLVPRLVHELADFVDVRFGLLLYRDYSDNFNTKGLPVKYFPFTSKFDEFTKHLNGFKIVGTEGGDIPEPVYEALCASMDFYKWRDNAEKRVILIGDAEPHPTPRRSGKYTKELVEKTAKERNISISAIITPDDKSRRGR